MLTTSSKRVGNESWQWRAFLFCSQKNWSFLTSFFLFLSAFSFSCSILHTRVWESNERPIGTNCIFSIFKIGNKMGNDVRTSTNFCANTNKYRKTHTEIGRRYVAMFLWLVEEMLYSSKGFLVGVIWHFSGGETLNQTCSKWIRSEC